MISYEYNAKQIIMNMIYTIRTTTGYTNKSDSVYKLVTRGANYQHAY